MTQHATQDARPPLASPGDGRRNGVSADWLAAVQAPPIRQPNVEGWAWRPLVERPMTTPVSPQGAHPIQPTGLNGNQPNPQPTGLDTDLTRSVRRSGYARRAFYGAVLIAALAGQATGLGEVLNLPLEFALPAVAAIELGGIVILNNADVRRRLGEHATGSRLLSAAIAVGATAFNWLAHSNHIAGGFFAGMSALGYLVWLTHTENQRRDRLRAARQLPPTTPAYELWGHWIKHPFLTARAKSLAKRNPQLGLYGSIDAAAEQVSTARRDAAIAKVLHRKVRAAVDPTTADIAVRVYNLNEIAARLAANADYDGLTGLIGAELTPERLAAAQPTLLAAPAVEDAQPTGTPTVQPSPLPAAQPTFVQPISAHLQPTGRTGGRPAGRNSGRRAGQPTRRAGAAKHAQPTSAPTAQPSTQPGGLTDVVRQRVEDLAKEFQPTDTLPGRDKVMALMTERGYPGWTSKTTAEKAIAAFKASRTQNGAQQS